MLLLLFVQLSGSADAFALLKGHRLPRASPMQQQATSAPMWDAERGEWVGGRALADDEALEVPKPLYIFGYVRASRLRQSDRHCKSIPCRLIGVSPLHILAAVLAAMAP